MFQNSRYIISAVSKNQYPNKENFSEFVFLGRSNVGKSSLVNAVTNNKILAKVSSKPGKTQTINFFLIDDSFYFIDVPGYGYAQRSKETRQNFGSYIEDYLENNKNLKMVFLLVDFKVGPTKDDLIMLDFLKHHGYPITIVTTKADKIGRTLMIRHQRNIIEKVGTVNIIITSTSSKLGISELQNYIYSKI